MSSALLRSRIVARARRAHLSLELEQLKQLERYYLLLERWNRKINLTALPLADYPGPTLDRLFVEPLLAASYVGDSPLSWVDFGSGSGSPAVPLKVARPQAALTMVEAKERKAAFLREVVSSLGLSETRVLTGRFEELKGSELDGTIDLVTARAVKVDSPLLNSAAALLRPRGHLVLFRSMKQPVLNDLRLISVGEVLLEPLLAGLTILEKRV